MNPKTYQIPGIEDLFEVAQALSAFESLTEMEMLYAQTVARYNQAQLFLIKATGKAEAQADDLQAAKPLNHSQQ